jgi:hypothetical protein
MTFACASCQMVQLFPIMPFVLAIAAPIILAYSYCDYQRSGSVGQGITTLLTCLGLPLLFMVFMPFLLPIFVLIIPILLLTRLADKRCRKTALAGLVASLGAFLISTMIVRGRDKYYELDEYTIKGHMAQTYARRDYPFGLDTKELVAALSNGGPKRAENAQELLKARAYQVGGSERREILELLRSTGSNGQASAELETLYRGLLGEEESSEQPEPSREPLKVRRPDSSETFQRESRR